jgi:hypothetical protein
MTENNGAAEPRRIKWLFWAGLGCLALAGSVAAIALESPANSSQQASKDQPVAEQAPSCDAWRESNAALRSDVEDLEADKDSLEADNQALEDQIAALEADKRNLQDDLEAAQEAPEPAPAAAPSTPSASATATAASYEAPENQPRSVTKHVEVVVSADTPVDVSISDDNFKVNIGEEVSGTKSYEFDIAADSGLLVDAMTMKSHANVSIGVYEDGELVHQDTDSSGWAQVSY